MICWICGDDEASTREHLSKASDIKALFGKPSQSNPLFINSSDPTTWRRHRNVKVGSLKSAALKFTHRICLTCNSSRTQPYDYAWERCSERLRDALPGLSAKGSFRANSIFPHDTQCGMQRVHLYFTKILGCLAVEGKIRIDIASLAKALVDGKPHQNIYLAFGYLPLPVAAIGGTEVHTAEIDGRVAFASWIYHVGGLAVNVMYAIKGERREGLKLSWHPRLGSKKIGFSRF
jgi:hypothetical protein